MRVSALVTIYNPSGTVIENLKSISAQADRVFIIDNSPSESESIRQAFKDYIFNNGNLGLSKAFNKVLKDSSINWNDDDIIIFFDQDSKIDNNHVGKLLNDFLLLKRKGYPIGCLGAFWRKENGELDETVRLAKTVSAGCYLQDVILTSSMMTSYRDLRDIGFWNEAVFLDMADWDLCWRFRKAGKKCVLSANVEMKHHLGDGNVSKFGMRVKNGAPVREYYQTRDGLKLLFESYTPVKYRMRIIAQITIRPVLHLLVLDDKRQRLRYIRKGVRDFFKRINVEFQA